MELVCGMGKLVIVVDGVLGPIGACGNGWFWVKIGGDGDDCGEGMVELVSWGGHGHGELSDEGRGYGGVVCAEMRCGMGLCFCGLVVVLVLSTGSWFERCRLGWVGVDARLGFTVVSGMVMVNIRLGYGGVGCSRVRVELVWKGDCISVVVGDEV
jgi:hypothetical protein